MYTNTSLYTYHICIHTLILCLSLVRARSFVLFFFFSPPLSRFFSLFLSNTTGTRNACTRVLFRAPWRGLLYFERITWPVLTASSGAAIIGTHTHTHKHTPTHKHTHTRTYISIPTLSWPAVTAFSGAAVIGTHTRTHTHTHTHTSTHIHTHIHKHTYSLGLP